MYNTFISSNDWITVYFWNVFNTKKKLSQKQKKKKNYAYYLWGYTILLGCARESSSFINNELKNTATTWAKPSFFSVIGVLFIRKEPFAKKSTTNLDLRGF